jgi:PPK2 family polyphosphate:nucleotide phosphotransferase
MDEIATLLFAGPGFSLAEVDPESTPGFEGGKKDGEKALAKGAPVIAQLQERLFAAGRSGDPRRVLLVLQAMDTAGKGGIVSHVVGSVDVQGVALHAFKAPTDEEKRHDFLWRIREQLPPAGMLGVFDRSHYEDVLIHRVRHLSPLEIIEARYGRILEFEEELADAGVSMVKVMLHISSDEQRDRLLARLDDPSKHWKFSPGDVDERQYWDRYMEAYEIAIRRTTTVRNPWYVIPANHKWYARLAVQRLLIDALARMDLQWPPADYDVAAERARLTTSLAGNR